MVSQWAADDAATARLMHVCYLHLADGTASPAAALRAAQQEVRRTHRHPYHWAPFSIVGAA
jgi:CHAT domain-containing protein